MLSLDTKPAKPKVLVEVVKYFDVRAIVQHILKFPICSGSWKNIDYFFLRIDDAKGPCAGENRCRQLNIITLTGQEKDIEQFVVRLVLLLAKHEICIRCSILSQRCQTRLLMDLNEYDTPVLCNR